MFPRENAPRQLRHHRPISIMPNGLLRRLLINIVASSWRSSASTCRTSDHVIIVIDVNTYSNIGVKLSLSTTYSNHAQRQFGPMVSCLHHVHAGLVNLLTFQLPRLWRLRPFRCVGHCATCLIMSPRLLVGIGVAATSSTYSNHLGMPNNDGLKKHAMSINSSVASSSMVQQCLPFSALPPHSLLWSSSPSPSSTATATFRVSLELLSCSSSPSSPSWSLFSAQLLGSSFSQNIDFRPLFGSKTSDSATLASSRYSFAKDLHSSCRAAQRRGQKQQTSSLGRNPF